MSREALEELYLNSVFNNPSLSSKKIDSADVMQSIWSDFNRITLSPECSLDSTKVDYEPYATYMELIEFEGRFYSTREVAEICYPGIVARPMVSGDHSIIECVVGDEFISMGHECTGFDNYPDRAMTRAYYAAVCAFGISEARDRVIKSVRSFEVKVPYFEVMIEDELDKCLLECNDILTLDVSPKVEDPIVQTMVEINKWFAEHDQGVYYCYECSVSVPAEHWGTCVSQDNSKYPPWKLIDMIIYQRRIMFLKYLGKHEQFEPCLDDVKRLFSNGTFVEIMRQWHFRKEPDCVLLTSFHYNYATNVTFRRFTNHIILIKFVLICKMYKVFEFEKIADFSSVLHQFPLLRCVLNKN